MSYHSCHENIHIRFLREKKQYLPRDRYSWRLRYWRMYRVLSRRFSTSFSTAAETFGLIGPTNSTPFRSRSARSMSTSIASWTGESISPLIFIRSESEYMFQSVFDFIIHIARQKSHKMNQYNNLPGARLEVCVKIVEFDRVVQVDFEEVPLIRIHWNVGNVQSLNLVIVEPAETIIW